MTLDELIDQVAVLDRLAQQVQVDDVAAGARAARQLGDDYDEWFTRCLLLLPADLREKFRFEYEGSVRTLQYRIKHFLHEPVKPRPKFFGGRQKRPSEHQGLLGYWQHPYADRFRGPIKTQKQLLLEARARLAAPAPSVHRDGSAPEPDRDRTVFVIHGRDKRARRALFDFLRAIGLQPLEWSQVLAEVRQGSPKIGDVLHAVLGKGRAVIVLATPDDVVRLKAEHADDEHDPATRPAGQARPNVIYETGMAMMLVPERTILVELGKVRRFTDLDGHFVVRLTNDPAPRKLLAQRLSDVGCAVDLSGSDWLEAGDLSGAVETAF
ncbi:TIR domain-containing protein [Actinosynnema sp. NPDC049800]